jgi:hypothetical protein
MESLDKQAFALVKKLPLPGPLGDIIKILESFFPGSYDWEFKLEKSDDFRQIRFAKVKLGFFKSLGRENRWYEDGPFEILIQTNGSNTEALELFAWAQEDKKMKCKVLVEAIKAHLAARLSSKEVKAVRFFKQESGEFRYTDYLNDNPADCQWQKKYYRMVIELP